MVGWLVCGYFVWFWILVTLITHLDWFALPFCSFGLFPQLAAPLLIDVALRLRRLFVTLFVARTLRCRAVTGWLRYILRLNVEFVTVRITRCCYVVLLRCYDLFALRAHRGYTDYTHTPLFGLHVCWLLRSRCVARYVVAALLICYGCLRLLLTLLIGTVHLPFVVVLWRLLFYAVDFGLVTFARLGFGSFTLIYALARVCTFITVHARGARLRFLPLFTLRWLRYGYTVQIAGWLFARLRLRCTFPCRVLRCVYTDFVGHARFPLICLLPQLRLVVDFVLVYRTRTDYTHVYTRLPTHFTRLDFYPGLRLRVPCVWLRTVTVAPHGYVWRLVHCILRLRLV